MAEQVVARYPGVGPARNFQITWGWGIRPETQRIETTYNHLPTARIGTISLQGLASGKRLELPYCRVAKQADEGAGVCTIEFEDRRWFWQFGSIDGDYNFFDPLTLTFRRQTSARDLARLCLAAMNEINYNVDALPSNHFPRRQWNASNPASELERLGLEYGCVVCLDPISDRVRLCRIGIGDAAPDGEAIKRYPGIYAPPLPSQIRSVGGTALFQTAFTIGRPFARELDGRLVLLDSVSYRPAQGWGSCSPFTFNHIEGTTVINGEKVYHRDLALESVWRYYELGMPATGWAPAPLVGSPYAPTSLADMGPFLDTRLEKDPITDLRQRMVVRGPVYFDSEDSRNKSVNGDWPGEIRFIDPERPIFNTSEPLFKYSGTNFVPSPATGIVIVGHAIKKEGVQLRYEKWLDNSGAPTPAGPQIEHHSDIVREFIAARSTNGGLGNLPDKDNLDKCDAQAIYYLNSLAANLVDLQAETVQKTGLFLDTGLDGAIRRLVWSGGPDVAPSTTIARNNEPNPYIQPWENRPSQVNKKIAEAIARRALAEEKRANRRAGIL